VLGDQHVRTEGPNHPGHHGVECPQPGGAAGAEHGAGPGDGLVGAAEPGRRVSGGGDHGSPGELLPIWATSHRAPLGAQVLVEPGAAGQAHRRLIAGDSDTAEHGQGARVAIAVYPKPVNAPSCSRRRTWARNFRSKGSTGQGAGQETCPLGRAALPFRITRSHQSESPRFRGIATGQAQLQQNFERLR